MQEVQPIKNENVFNWQEWEDSALLWHVETGAASLLEADYDKKIDKYLKIWTRRAYGLEEDEFESTIVFHPTFKEYKEATRSYRDSFTKFIKRFVPSYDDPYTDVDPSGSMFSDWFENKIHVNMEAESYKETTKVKQAQAKGFYGPDYRAILLRNGICHELEHLKPNFLLRDFMESLKILNLLPIMILK
ncbi:hypothetical protein GF362_02600 [Candidatus Dojkabacteria bacterium]|nr:hypothetical protein [Candidatus Dojkabacteria bacterium]